jgi:hypothetical protein
MVVLEETMTSLDSNLWFWPDGLFVSTLTANVKQGKCFKSRMLAAFALQRFTAGAFGETIFLTEVTFDARAHTETRFFGWCCFGGFSS